MTIERAQATAVPKPWGVADLTPWSNAGSTNRPIGEIWFEPPVGTGKPLSLRLKLLFTSQPLSIQVHPNDAYAQSIGLSSGKTEAWYVLSAEHGSEVALGLRFTLSLADLLLAIDDGSIADCISWQKVSRGDTVFVPAGTIHAIGAGLVIAEIQQRSDVTFRLFDFDRARELHVTDAVAVAQRGPAAEPRHPIHFSEQRTMLSCDPSFVFERLDLPPKTVWSIDAAHETWLLVLHGSAGVGALEITLGDVLFAQTDEIAIRVGTNALSCLVAYTGTDGPLPNLLRGVLQ
jgi:mannose-6-phosphate isomerase